MTRTQSASGAGETAEAGVPVPSRAGARRADENHRWRHRRARPRRRWLTHISPLGLLLAAALFVAADVGDQLTGGDTFLTSGPLDETAHLLTTLIVLWAIGGVVWERLLIPALIASVAIDLDHIPRDLGYGFFTVGTPRPYTHSLLTIAAVLIAAGLWRRRRTVLLAVAVGLALHFWRDTAEPGSGVALLWPFSDHSFSTSQSSYLILLGVAFAVGMSRSLRTERGVPEPRAPDDGAPPRGRHRKAPSHRPGRELVAEGPGG